MSDALIAIAVLTAFLLFIGAIVILASYGHSQEHQHPRINTKNTSHSTDQPSTPKPN